jgi:hypothetical protein
VTPASDWRGGAPKLHVLDQSTWAALRQLSASGLITFNTRATRHLTGDTPQPSKPALTAEQLQRIAELRALAAKKQKVAQLLVAAELADEAEPHQKAAKDALAEALAIENDPGW